jgi:hypothetical protein
VKGRYGRALRFASERQRVSLRRLSTGATRIVTVTAWIKPESRRDARVVVVNGDDRVAVPRSVKAGEWVHVAATWSGGNVRSFVNGHEVVARSTRQGAPAAALQLGGFKGRLDEVRLYDRALSASELQAEAAA